MGLGRDSLAVVVVLAFFAFFGIIGLSMYDVVYDGFMSSSVNSVQITETANAFYNYFYVLDYVTVFLLVCLIAGSIYSSYKVRSSPIAVVVSVVLVPVMGFMGYFASYMFQMMVSPTVLGSALGFFGKSYLICSNLHWVALFNLIVSAVSLYAKRDDSSEVGSGGSLEGLV